MAAKKKKRTKLKHKVWEEITTMGWVMDAHCVAEMECWVCSEKQEKESEISMEDARIKLAEQLLQEGWEYINSDKYETQGWACEQCSKRLDKLR